MDVDYLTVEKQQVLPRKTSESKNGVRRSLFQEEEYCNLTIAANIGPSRKQRLFRIITNEI